MKMSDSIGLEIERREKAMTFEEWIQKWRDAQPDGKLPHELEEGAEEAWDFQQARIEALEKAAIDAVQGYENYAESGFEEVLDPPMMALAALLQETDHE